MARQDLSFSMEDVNLGRVKFRVVDRITPDDVVVHMLEREFFRLAGGKAPGDEVDREFVDFLVRSGSFPGL